MNALSQYQALFAQGLDTMDIAERLDIPESVVWNILRTGDNLPKDERGSASAVSAIKGTRQ